METPQTSRYVAETLPSDIWAYISFYLDGEHLGRLKMTGSKSLWGRLRIPHVVKSVSLGKDFIRFKSWPAFLNELPSIQSLSIYSIHKIWWSDFGIRLDSLPRTLQQLRFCGEFENFDLFFFNKDGQVLNIEEQMPHLNTLILKNVSIKNCTWMKSFPKSLTTLKALHIEGDVILPNSLIHLKVHISNEVNLPPGVETLHTWHLPDVALLTRLPLLSLKVIGMGALQEAIPTSPSRLALLPSTLTVINTQSILPASCWPYLPLMLSKLTIGVSKQACANVTRAITDPTSGSVHHVETYPFELLPKSITFIQFLPWYTIEILALPPSEPNNHSELETSPSSRALSGSYAPTSCNPYFADRLKTLIAPDLQLSTKAAKLLPPSLTRLNIHCLSKNICQHLPSGIRTLDCQSALMSTELINLLPKSLSSISLIFAWRGANWIDEDTGKIIRSSAIPGYDDGIGPDIWQGIHALPPNLTSFSFHLMSSIGDAFAIQNHPNLLKLELPHTTLMTDLAIPHLNRHLTHLNLSNSQSITGKCFPFLPRGLLHLNLTNCSSILDSHICNLPRTLKEAYLWSATQLTDHCIKDFPRQMQTLALGKNTNITKACLADLPSPIKGLQNRKSFTAGGWNIFNGIIRDKPSTLTVH